MLAHATRPTNRQGRELIAPMGNWGRCRFVEKEKKKKRDENFKAAEWSLEKEYSGEGFVIFSRVVSKSKWTFHRWRHLQKHKISNIFSSASSRPGGPFPVRILAANHTDAADWSQSACPLPSLNSFVGPTLLPTTLSSHVSTPPLHLPNHAIPTGVSNSLSTEPRALVI